MAKIDIVLDATMLDTFMLCQCKFNYRFNHNFQTPVKAKPLDRGSMVHIGEEVYFGELKKNNSWANAVDAMIKAVQIEASAPECSLEPEETKRIVDVLIETTGVWKESDLQMEVLAVEQSFMYVLYEDDDIRIIMIGKIDLLVNQHPYKRMPVDHKSYDRSYPVQRKTNQFQNYAYATESSYLLVNRIGFQTSIKPAEKHKRVPLCYDPLILAQWKENVIHWAKYYVECAVDNKWPMNDTSCDKYNRTCEYYDVCDSSGEPAKVHKLETNFIIGEPWDVSKSLSRKGQ